MRKNTITFDNGNQAVVVTAGRDADAQSILKTLDIAQPQALIMVFGGAKGLDDSRKARLVEVFTNAIAPAAAELGALVMDGGTQSGVMAMMGEAFARDGRRSQLLGIAPAGKVSYPGGQTDASIVNGASLEPNHSHFILVESDEWGTMLINGGQIAGSEALQSVRNGWQLFVIEGTGRFADELSAAVRDGQVTKPVEVSEIARSDRITLFPVSGPAEKLRNELRRILRS